MYGGSTGHHRMALACAGANVAAFQHWPAFEKEWAIENALGKTPTEGKRLTFQPAAFLL
jgi:hypothetical protein